MLWLKSFHIIFMVTWFAGLFYLPRIFVYHAMSTNEEVQKTLQVMQKKLLIMTHIGGVLTWAFGLALLHKMPLLLDAHWMRAKLSLVLLLTVYHLALAKLVATFSAGNNKRSHVWFRWFNEIPTVILISVVLLVVLKSI